MASTHILPSSPLQGSTRERLEIGSSSPDLPPLQDILSQRSTRPPLRSGSKAVPIPDDAPIAFISARNLLQSTETPPEVPPAGKHDHSVPEQAHDPSHEESIIEVLPEKPKNPPKSQAQNVDNNEPDGAKKARGKRKPKPTETSRVRKQPRPKAKGDENENEKEAVKSKAKSTKAKATRAKGSKTTAKKKADDDISESTNCNQAPLLKAPNIEEPLNLEPATTRKVDWTPPARKTVISLDSDSSAFKQVTSPGSAQQASVFRDLVQGYSCAQESPEVPSAPSDEDSSFLKKRKRIELVALNDATIAEPEISTKSPTKKKAPKKKARTITELATAAYRKSAQPDESMPSGATSDHFPPKNVDSAAESVQPAGKGKGKAPSRKKPSKTSKKKAPPPKPILLSPGAALDQVAKQDFVFGTSSQLAREPSPTVLRDIQAALRQSTQPDPFSFPILINSDEIEAPEQRPRLWDAAARDADGDLFDVEVIDLADGSPQFPAANGDIDPFGYVKSEGQNQLPSIPIEKSVASENTDSFVDLSDILPSPSSKTVPVSNASCFLEGDVNISADIPNQGSPHIDSPHPLCNPSAIQPSSSQPNPGCTNLSPRPDYEHFTDLQLAKEIKAYGFKPIKRRNAMIALLDQCWQSKVRLNRAGIHTITTQATPTSNSNRSNKPSLNSNRDQNLPKNEAAVSEPQDAFSSGIPEKRPQGRPRKNSVSSPEPQEPPPSAQPPETPKRPRGRPRKDSTSPSPTTSSRSRTRSASPKKSISGHSSVRRKKVIAPVIEIPDSASDGSGFTSSLSPTVEETFSSPPIDMSLSTTDETELSLATSPDSQQTLLFEYITKAIKSAPRTTDPANPSWHERILLYDPIVLEDLTSWLNSGQLSRVGFDAEISPGEVKKWCESRSICSVWRVNLRGKERRRF